MEATQKEIHNSNYSVHLSDGIRNMGGFKMNKPKCKANIGFQVYTTTKVLSEVTCKRCLAKIESLQQTERGRKILNDLLQVGSK